MKKKTPMAAHLGRLLLCDPTTAALRKLERLLNEGASMNQEDTDAIWSLIHECAALSLRADKWANRLRTAIARSGQQP